MELKIGSIVRLNSGGPPMTVSRILEDGQIICTWRHNDGTLDRAEFHPAMLAPAPVAAEPTTFRDHGDWLKNIAEKA